VEFVRNVFVYGTLMRDFGGNWILEGNFLSWEKATAKGTMFSMGGFPMCDMRDESNIVRGEVYEIDLRRWEQTLARLDQLEGYRPGSNYMLYERILVEVTTESGEKKQAWVYTMPEKDQDRRELPSIPSGDWREHTRREYNRHG